MKRLAVITTHPIQYNAPLFRMLSERRNIGLKVFYTWSQSEAGNKFDPGFGKAITWDIPLLEGYDHAFSKNISASPGSHHFKGIDNPGLIKEIEAWKPDALLVYGWSFKSHFKAMRYFHKKIPVLFRGDSTLLDEQPGIKKTLRRIFLKYVYSFADLALYAGKANAAYFKKHGFKDGNMIFMPHAIDNSRFEQNEKLISEAKQMRSSLNIPDNATVFLFAGKLDENKNTAMLAEAFIKTGAEHTFLIIAGSGATEQELKIKYETHPRIRFIGFQNQDRMPVVYALCDVYVMPSKSETWGLGINEAMAAGKAIIASDSCGASFDLIQNGENGFVFKKNDSAGLEAHISAFSKDKTLSKRMGEHSLKTIKKYSYAEDCAALEKAVTR